MLKEQVCVRNFYLTIMNFFQPPEDCLNRSVLIVVVLLAVMISAPANAEQGHSSPITDLRVIVDISGSMKKTDPKNLRRPAIRLLAGLIP
ncbi:MAG: hypothetical protein OEW97_08870, partial [Gammaproteobacteria bacterium]|nr:hypothetical protein [Gammaproteobacteria bacterium]